MSNKFSDLIKIAMVCILGVVIALTTGCGFARVEKNQVKPGELIDVATFYLQYAPLAADVYVTEGEFRYTAILAASSPLLREELSRFVADKSKTADAQQLAQRRFDKLNSPDLVEKEYIEKLIIECSVSRYDAEELAYQNLQIYELSDYNKVNCLVDNKLPPEIQEQLKINRSRSEKFADSIPTSFADCESDDEDKIKVPLGLLTQQHRWKRVPEMQKYASAKGWAIFVPELAIDVWRRERSAIDGEMDFEYAIVYRGTAGAGGWFTNFRPLTVLSPMVYDQYKQSQKATALIIKQIVTLHGMSQWMLSKDSPRKIFITAVGHSLGAGLARYNYYLYPEITKVVGFNSSPIDGTATIPLALRSEVGLDRPLDIDRRLKQPPSNDNGAMDRDTTTSSFSVTTRRRDPSPIDSAADVHLLYEQGEVLSKILPCFNGTIWGADGGPTVSCKAVNMASGAAVDQHKMRQMACRLYLASQGQATSQVKSKSD